MTKRLAASAAAALCAVLDMSAAARAAKPTPPAPQFVKFAGHWQCNGTHRERSYVVLGNELFVRAFQKDGKDPLERFQVSPDAGGFEEYSSDGVGIGTFRDDGALVMSGQSSDSHTPVTITTRVDGDVLTRQVARDGSASFEMCDREPALPPPTTCDTPNVAATVLRAATPRTPATRLSGTTGLVQIRLVLDDRSNIIWSNPLQTDSVLLNASAVAAAHESTFRTEVAHCVPQAAAYIFSVEY